MKIWKGVGWEKLIQSCPFVGACSMCASSGLHLHSQLSHSGCIITHNWLMFASFFPALFLTDMYYCRIPTISCTRSYMQKWHAGEWIGLLTFSKFFLVKVWTFLGQHREKLLSINYNVNIELKVKKMRHFPANFVLWFKFCPFFGCGGLEVQENFFEFQARPR